MIKGRKAASIGVIIYILCAYLAFFLYSPRLSVNEIKQALQQKDAELLDDYIDFRAIQNSLKAQIKAEIILNASEQINQFEVAKPLLMTEVSYAIRMVEDFIELFISKEGFSRLFKMDAKSLNNGKATDARKLVYGLQSEAFIESDSFEFTSYRTIQVRGYSGSGKQHEFIFTFRYVKWVLTDINIGMGSVDNKKVIKFIQKFQQE